MRTDLAPDAMEALELAAAEHEAIVECREEEDERIPARDAAIMQAQEAGATYAAIAERLGISEVAVHKALSRARQAA